MRHQMTTPKLNRPVGHRQALVKNLVSQLYLHETIVTTQAKAKTVQRVADRLIHKARLATVAQKGRLASQRELAQFLTQPGVVKKLVEEIAPRYPEKFSGFTRLIKLGARVGDRAMMVKLALVAGQTPVVTKVDQKPIEQVKKTAPRVKKTTSPQQETSKKSSQKFKS